MTYELLNPISDVIRTTEPTFEQEPLSLAEAKMQCGVAIDVDYHDPLLRQIISAARQQVENDTGIVCYTGSHTWKFTDWPCDSYLEIPGKRPVTSITSITYVDTDGNTQTWGSSNYVLDTAGVKPFIRLAYATDWPSIRGDINGITVTLIAGYATVAAVPQRIKQACLLLVNHWFANRDTVSVGTISPDISLTYDALVGGLSRRSYP